MDYKHGGNLYALENKEKIIDFSSNVNPLGPPKNLEETIVEACEIVHQYPDPNYRDMLKKLAKLYDIKEESFLVGNGGIQVIHNAIEFLEFDKALIIAPTFVEYEKALNRFGKPFRYYYLKEEEDFKLNIRDLLSSDLFDIDLIILCSPNNPTGVYLEKQDMCQLVNGLSELNINILIDEAFADFLSDHVSMINQVPKYKNMVITRSLTKFFAVPGVRLGFLVTSNKILINKINQWRESWTVNVFAEQLFLRLFDDQKYILETKKYVVEESDRLYNQLNNTSAIKVYKPSVNYIFFKSKKNISWKDELLKYDILIRQCNNYRGLSDKYYRLAVRSRKENNILIEAMNKVLEAFNE